MKNFNQLGCTISMVAAAAVAAGEGVVSGTLLAVATEDAAIGESFNADLEGVFELPKDTSTEFTQGQMLVWDASAGEFIEAATEDGDLENCAFAWKAAAEADATVQARLCPGFGSVATVSTA
ncbi:MAG: capsid cement protein [Aeromonas veronii]